MGAKIIFGKGRALGILLAAFFVLPVLDAEAAEKSPFLGLRVQGLSKLITDAIDFPGTNGVLIRDVGLGTPAGLAGFRRGDVLIEVEGEKVNSVEQIANLTNSLSPGKMISTTLWRKGKTLNIKFPLGVKPGAWSVTRNLYGSIKPLGLTISSLTEKVRTQFGLRWGSTGVVVTLVEDEKVPGMDIHPGDVIVQINQQDVWEPGHVVASFQKAQKAKKDYLLVLIERSDGFRFAMLPVPH